MQTILRPDEWVTVSKFSSYAVDLSSTNFELPYPKLPKVNDYIYTFAAIPDFVSMTAPMVLEIKLHNAVNAGLSGNAFEVTLSGSGYATMVTKVFYLFLITLRIVYFPSK